MLALGRGPGLGIIPFRVTESRPGCSILNQRTFDGEVLETIWMAHPSSSECVRLFIGMSFR